MICGCPSYSTCLKNEGGIFVSQRWQLLPERCVVKSCIFLHAYRPAASSLEQCVRPHIALCPCAAKQSLWSSTPCGIAATSRLWMPGRQIRCRSTCFVWRHTGITQYVTVPKLIWHGHPMPFTRSNSAIQAYQPAHKGLEDFSVESQICDVAKQWNMLAFLTSTKVHACIVQACLLFFLNGAARDLARRIAALNKHLTIGVFSTHWLLYIVATQ